MPGIRNVQALCCLLLNLMRVLTSQEVCVFEGSAPLLSYPSLPSLRVLQGRRRQGIWQTPKGLGRARIHLSVLRYA